MQDWDENQTDHHERVVRRIKTGWEGQENTQGCAGKRSATSSPKEWLPVVGERHKGVRECEVPTTWCKIGLRMYCTAQKIEPRFSINCKWKVNFKNCIKVLKI